MHTLFSRTKWQTLNTQRHGHWGKLAGAWRKRINLPIDAHRILAFVIGCSWRGKCYRSVDVASPSRGGFAYKPVHGIMNSLEAGLSQKLRDAPYCL